MSRKIYPTFPHNIASKDLYYRYTGGGIVDYIEFFYNRITQLRLQKGVSARDMSLSLGQSESYINKIENRRTLPSFSGFIYICEYFGITPADFFNSNSNAPHTNNQIAVTSEKLTPTQAEHILALIQDLTQSNEQQK